MTWTNETWARTVPWQTTLRRRLRRATPRVHANPTASHLHQQMRRPWPVVRRMQNGMTLKGITSTRTTACHAAPAAAPVMTREVAPQSLMPTSRAVVQHITLRLLVCLKRRRHPLNGTATGLEREDPREPVFTSSPLEKAFSAAALQNFSGNSEVVVRS